MMNDYEKRCTVPRCWITSPRYLLAGVALIALGIVLGSASIRPSTAWGEIRMQPPAEHFKSGDQLSVPLLQEISATLRQIDARLARLEAAAKVIQSQRIGTSSP
jgi:hypothetical protein